MSGAYLNIAPVGFDTATIQQEWTAADGREVVAVGLGSRYGGTYFTVDDPAVALQLADTMQQAARLLRARQLVAERNAAVAIAEPEPVEPEPFDMSGPSRHAGAER